MENYPNMINEVLEAVHNTFVDYPEVEADCYVYLAHALTKGGYRAEESLTEMNRCAVCGCELMVQTYREPHTEFNPVVYETMHEVYCPVCDA